MAKRKSAVQEASAITKKKRATPVSTNTRRVTRLMTTDAARRAVFDTAELLEQIMLELPVAAILTSQRVCHQVQDIVTTSIKIQEKLFFRTNGNHERWTPLQPGNYYQGVRRLESGEEHPEFVTVPAHFNQFFRKITPDEYIYDRFELGQTIIPESSLMAELLRLLRENDRVSSCSNMQLTDKSTTNASVWFRWAIGNGKPTGTLTAGIDAPLGITVHDLVEAMRTPATHIVFEAGVEPYRNEAPAGSIRTMQATELKVRRGRYVNRAPEVTLQGVVLPSQEERLQYMSGTVGAIAGAD